MPEIITEREKLNKSNTPFLWRAEFELYLEFENKLNKHFLLPGKDMECSLKEIYSFTLSLFKDLKISSKEWVRLLDFAEIFIAKYGKPELRSGSSEKKSHAALVILESLGFHERSRKKGNYTYVRVNFSDLCDLLVKIENNEAIGHLITLRKINGRIDQHAD